jgi:NarL family two-component system response regulator LiaR
MEHHRSRSEVADRQSPGGAEPPASLRVIIADDDALARRVLRDALQADGVIVIADASDGREAVELTVHYKPDVVVMDVTMPRMDGLEATRTIVARVPEAKVVMLTATEDLELGLVALRAGAVGFLPKTSPPEALPQALRAARNGEAVFSRKMTMALVDVVRRVRDDGAGLRPVRSPLTGREWEVLDLLCEGRSTDAIAGALFLSDETVRSHIKNILRKLGVRSRQEAVDRARAVRVDLMTPHRTDQP